MRNITIAAFSFLMTMMIGMAIAHAQATNSVVLALSQKSFEVSAADDTARVNLLKEIQKVNPAAISSGQLEIQMLRLKAKTGIGGAQFFLRINGSYVDSQSLETDADQFATADVTSAGRIELKNITRDAITEASLIIQDYSNAKLISVEAVLGPVSEVAILGHYADEQVQLVGSGNEAGATQDVVLKPTAAALTDIQNRYYSAGAIGGTAADGSAAAPASSSTAAAPAAAANSNDIANQMAATLQTAAEAVRNGAKGAPAATPAAATPVVQQNSTKTQHESESRPAPAAVAVSEKPQVCVTNQRGNRICVGDKVHNRWGFSGVVQDLQKQAGINMALVKFGFGDTKWRDVDSISN